MLPGNQLRVPRPNSDCLVDIVSPRKHVCVSPGRNGQEIAYLLLESGDGSTQCDEGEDAEEEEEEDEEEGEEEEEDDEDGTMSPFIHANHAVCPRNGAKTKKERLPH